MWKPKWSSENLGIRCALPTEKWGKKLHNDPYQLAVQLVLFGVIRRYWCTENARYYDHKHTGKQNMHSGIAEW
jgi:hypothetical protein